MTRHDTGVRADSLLQPLLTQHLMLLERWLKQPHVAPWYPLPERDLQLARNPPDHGSHALLVQAGHPVGYIRWQHVDRQTLDELGLFDIPANSVDIDLLLGETAYLGRGIGPAALNDLAAQLKQEGNVPLLGLTTSVNNHRAHRAFAKAGFRISRQYDPNGLGICHLMTRDLAIE